MLMIFRLTQCSDKFTDKHVGQPEESEANNIDEEGFETIVTKMEDLVIDTDQTSTDQPTGSANDKPRQPSGQPQQCIEYQGGEGYEHGATGGDQSDEEDNNFEVIVKELEDLLEEDEATHDSFEPGKQKDQPVTETMEIGWPPTPEKSEKKVSIIPEMVLLKKGSGDNLVPMNISDYFVKGYDQFGIKYEFNTPLEKLLANKDPIWEHEQGKAYPEQLIYKEKRGIYILIFRHLAFVYRKVFDHWNLKILRPPKGIKIYDIDEQGRVIPIFKSQYNVQPTGFGSFRYILKEGIKCRIIEFQKTIVWGGDPSNGYVRTFSYVNDNLFVIFFHNYIVKVTRVNNSWTYLFQPRSSKQNFNEF
ncbi:SVSP family protein [Theileria parva strain Muguga]|uniref:Uncharacterized protein n=1 Tax=Theileria parva TaxID=5875 RepID=Q4N3G4_THEPA|nr:SVSP family protein [Theileria parva strain Muguga]EAN31371.1 SVSP family protein [Theileria parva strain Muguga]|eukprot:XP_763654.1 hypothetical protein [Theileria parva strain Muguga]